jgi:hypothetical protein
MFNIPLPTRPTTIDDVVDEDCIIDVARIPINRPISGWEVVARRDLAKSLPNNLKASPKRDIDNMKRYRNANSPNIFRIVLKTSLSGCLSC